MVSDFKDTHIKHVCQDMGERCWEGGRRIPCNRRRYYIAERAIKFFFFVAVMCVFARWKLAKTHKNNHGGRRRPPMSRRCCGASPTAPRHTTDSPHIELQAYVVKTKKILFLLLVTAILGTAHRQKNWTDRRRMWWLYGQSRASTTTTAAHIHSICSP